MRYFFRVQIERCIHATVEMNTTLFTCVADGNDSIYLHVHKEQQQLMCERENRFIDLIIIVE